MESDTTPSPRPRRALVGGAVAAAALALAVPASGALAGSDSSTTNGVTTTEPGTTPGFVQDRERSDGRDKRDCPEDGGGRSGENEGSSGQGVDESREL